MTDDVKLGGVADLYESEKALARTVLGALQRRYATQNMASEDVQRRFNMEARGVFAENGLVASVTWDYDVSDDPADQTLYMIPNIIIEARVDKVEQFDHDQQSHEVKTGVFDGVKGVIDPNTGQMREDSKKKLIT